MLETLQQLDQQLLLTLNGLHSPYWDSFMWLFTGRFIWIPMYATILYILCKNFNVYVTLLTAVAIALTITYADQLCATWIRPAVERLRPSNLNNPLSEFVHIVNGKRGGSYGFPSCHASNSFGLAFFLLFFFRQRWLSIFILCWAVLNCYTRIYLGVHYPGDLLAGMFVGLSGALIFYYLLRHTLRQKKIAGLLKYDEHNRYLIEHPKEIAHTRLMIYIGLITTGIIAIISPLITLHP